MKLVNKFTLWFLCIMVFTTLIGTAITYYSIKNKVDAAAENRLKSINQLAADRVRAGTLGDSVVQGRKISVHRVDGPMPARAVQMTEIRSIDLATNKPEYLITVNSYFLINGSTYLVSCYGYVSKADQILSGLEVSILWKWILIIALIAVSARLVSKKILAPFRRTLNVLEQFNLRKKEKVELGQTNTHEFRELNGFVKSMTDRAVDEYVSLKEFTENVSHELQTPVSVISHKLEFLAESAITEEQALLITDMRNSLDKLSRINSTLVLLTRLENHEFDTHVPLRFCKLINETLATYDELAAMKSITLNKEIAGSIYVQLHPTLGALLLNNLVSNAIRHNVENGTIDVMLTSSSLVIVNTGIEPSVPTEELFQRFRKGNTSSKSIGIGLSIVKQICEIHGFRISYTFNAGLHRVEIAFDEENTMTVDPVRPGKVAVPA